MQKRRKYLIILAIVLTVFILASIYFVIFRKGDGARAALTDLQLSELPAKVAKEAGHTTTVTAYDGGAVMTDYNGTIHFSSTDPAATLPSDYTFKDGSKEKTMTINGWDATLKAHSYATAANKLADNGVQNAYVGVFETTATGTQNGNLFIENDHSFNGGTTSDNNYDLADFITAANIRSVDVYAWITVFGPESTIDVGGVTYETWIDPASAEHQAYINSLITHLLTNYSGLKGIVIDYIRYADAGATEKYRVYKDGGTYTDYTGNFAPANATAIISNAVASYKTTVTGFPGKELAAEVYSASDDSTYNNWVTADLGQDYALMAANLDAILPMAYHIGYHGPQWVSEVVDYVYAKTHPGSSGCDVIPHVQTYQDGKDIEWPGLGEIAAATDPIDYAKVSGLAFYSYENTSDNEWVEVKDSFDDNGTKTFSNEILFGSTGTYNLKIEDIVAVKSDEQVGIVIFDGHANGSLVLAPGSPKVYFIQNGMKSWVISPSVFYSRFKSNQIVMISDAEMNNYVLDSGEPDLHYREGTIFKRADMPEVYAVEEQKKRHIDSPSTFNSKGYSWSNVVLAEDQSVLDAHTDGSDLTGASALPNGTLVKTSSAAEIFMLESGSRRHIPSLAVFNSQFRGQDVVIISTEAMSSYPIGSDYPFRAGTIIRDYDSGSIYFIEGEKKRHFTSPMFYGGLGYGGGYATDDSAQILDLYADGNDMYQLTKYIDIIGDVRNGHTVHQTLTDLITNDKSYLVFNVGDLVNTANSASDWATFDSITGSLRANTRYYPAIGNHEVASSYFEARFGTDKWYSKDIDNIHYIILDSNTTIANPSTQYSWLSNDITHQPPTTRFTLIFYHDPSFSAGGLVDAVALFEANGVDAVFTGHTHLYARKITTSIYYFIDGGGGAPLSSCPVAGYTNCHSEYEYMRLLLDNNLLKIRVYNSSGTEIDNIDLAGV